MPRPDGWRVRHLLASPHRLGFFLAMLVLAAAALWWAAVQLGRSGMLPAMAVAVLPPLVHAALMTFGFFPLFFAGFLFTAGPRWLHVHGPAARELLWPLVAQAGGWLVWLAGSVLSRPAAVAGLGLAAAGLIAIALRFWRLVRASSDTDRVHPTVIAGALAVGAACLTGAGISLLLHEDVLALRFVLTGLWGCVAVVFVTAGHRMIPFFTAAPGTPLDRRGDWAQLALLVGVAGFEALAVWMEDAMPGVAVWHLARALVELACGGMVLWGAVAWAFAKNLGNRLLRVMHTGVVWIALGLLLQGATALLEWRFGTPVLPLAGLHALAMGGLGTVMLAMVTRVSAAHAGIPVAADALVWVLFWLLQAATPLRVAASLPLVPAQALLTVSALLWAGLVVTWAVRYGSIYGRPAAAPRHR